MKPEESSTAPTSERRRRTRAWLRWLLGGLLALAVIYLAAYLGSLRMLHRAEARVAATGGSLRFADFVPPELPPGEPNASEFLEAAVKLVDEHETQVRAGVSGQQQRAELKETLLALDRYQSGVTPESLEVFRRWVDHSQPVLTLLDQARPIASARYDTEYLDVLPFEITIPNLLARLHLSNLLRARAFVAMDDGRPEDAYRDLVATFRLANWCHREMPPVLINNLVAVAIAQRACRTAELLMQKTPPTAEQQAEILAEARQLDPYEALNDPLHGERVASYLSLISRRPGPGKLLAEIIPGSAFDRFAVQVEATVPPLRMMNTAVYLEAMTTAIPLCERPSYQHDENFEERFNALVAVPRWMVLARALRINCATVAHKRDFTATLLDLMEIAFQLDRQPAETGHYPETLESLPGASFVDPFSGQPYRYRRTGDAYVVYSVSVNRRDDRGTVPPPQEMGGAPWINDGDIVWTME